MPKLGFILISMRVARIHSPRLVMMTSVASACEWIGDVT